MDENEQRRLGRWGVRRLTTRAEAAEMAIQVADATKGPPGRVVWDLEGGAMDRHGPPSQEAIDRAVLSAAWRFHTEVRMAGEIVYGTWAGPVFQDNAVRKRPVVARHKGDEVALAPAQFDASAAHDHVEGIKATITASGGTAHRTLATAAYVPVLLGAATFAAFLNVTALRVFRESEWFTFVAGLTYALLFMAGTHQFGLALSDDRPGRRLRTFAAVALLGVLTVATWAVAGIRAEYLELFGSRVSDLKFMAIQVAIDGIAVIASMLHANRAADILWAAGRARKRAFAAVEGLMADRDACVEEETALDQELYGLTEEAAQAIRSLDPYRLMLLDVFVRTFEHRLGIVVDTSRYADEFAARYPDELALLERWMADRAERLDRPRRLPPGGDPPALDSGAA
jgi:hypothetical protein